MKRKRTEITIEVDEMIYAVNHRQRLASTWCSACGDVAPMITPEEAAAMTQVTVRTVNQRVEAGHVHFVETPDGRLWVCVNSLSEPRAVVSEPRAIATGS
ncbi:MAG TPA: hypothetical protein VGJ55_17695 [Pyrinomonadaceae bacterium]|jgi:hypothetical protein